MVRMTGKGQAEEEAALTRRTMPYQTKNERKKHREYKQSTCQNIKNPEIRK